MFSFFHRLPLKKITVGVAYEAGAHAQRIVAGLVQDLPELLLTCVVEVATGKVLAFYTTSPAYNPHHISLRHAKTLRTIQQALTTGAWPGGPLTEVSLILDEEVHHLRPLQQGQWYCFLAVRTADTNLAIAKEVLRRHTA